MPQASLDIVDVTKRLTYGTWKFQKSWTPLHIVDAEGCYFTDANGKRYLDLSSQLMCVNLGHKNQAVIKAIEEQARTLPYIAPGYATDVRAELSQMKPGGCLINTARATVLDYDALTESLASGHLAAAALDVFPEEPLPSTSPLRRQPGLTLTPHIAGAAAEVTDRQSELLVDAVRGLYGGTGWDELPIRNRELQSRWEARHAAR